MNAKPLTLSAAAVYLTGLLVGYYMDSDFDFSLSEAKPPVAMMADSKSKLFCSIAGNNISVALINIGGGFSLGAISLLNTFHNGVVLGYALSVAGDNFSFALIIRHLLPHAIEIVAIILSGSLGFYLALYLFNKFVLGRGPVFDYQKFLILSATSLVILLLAAVMEVSVSFSG
ncbi:stage II sporulation protein M [Cyclobacterium jeungdonense]|uniref:Stage II sporulation protein M n=1 Tax=Cyclobacterium jeungdonense TaxID=708087 RepID=A0ABT8CAA6_9BACT|nr:stage II sporulation protein M [Cyclobacterium jeungdonense]MDN3688606.1 stage II sporulation protein M [Cyclobacterium jeungdonense]